MCIAWVVETLPFYSKYNRTLLEQEDNVDVIEFDNPKKVIRELEKGNYPNVVVLDTMLPFMDGEDLIDKIHKINNKIKFLIVTSDRRRMKDNKHELIPTIEKPFLVSEFKNKFRKVRGPL